MKLIAALAALLLVAVSLLVAGCTSPTTNPTPSPSTFVSTDTVAALTNDFTGRGFVVVQPFTKSTDQGGFVVYKGVIKDNEDTLTPYTHNITIILTKSRNETLKQYNKALNDAQVRGYQKILSGEMGSGTVWEGSVGRQYANQTNDVWVVAQQPGAGYEIIHGPGAGRAYAQSLSNEWLVSTAYNTKI
jgi:hypothetical protein